MALEAIKLMHAAGVPEGALQLLHSPGETMGAALVAAPGVVFTGSTQVAKIINRTLAAKRAGDVDSAIANLITSQAFEVNSIADMQQEIFGPVLHIVRWKGDPQAVIDQINDLGYGLTIGIQTRIDSRAQALAKAAHVGNAYQPQPDWRCGRCAALWRRRPLWHRPQGRRPALPVPLLRRANHYSEHHGGGWQRGLVGG
ncbi:aldehyde dehydrogenase family protein [Rhodoferax sp. PAMC 29310]|uniref:aldehyde dehydrogenase family protein n=1 Tax=Rhodoferax sp. PAMC 29310 TaxID=2822760 RepID=UPI0021025180|nr:aldehyde dehydrogenase family protein [Rhodoferax sp. PAMC 29310]